MLQRKLTEAAPNPETINRLREIAAEHAASIFYDSEWNGAYVVTLKWYGSRTIPAAAQLAIGELRLPDACYYRFVGRTNYIPLRGKPVATIRVRVR